MKKTLPIVCAVLVLLFLSACGTEAFPDDVGIYAKKHSLSCYSPEEAATDCLVGESCVVYGEISNIYFVDYYAGSTGMASIEETCADYPEKLKSQLLADIEGTMQYSIYLNSCRDCNLIYRGQNYKADMLNVNTGDKVAFLVTCIDSYKSGDYEYDIQEMVWVERQSEITAEEEYYAEQSIAPID